MSGREQIEVEWRDGQRAAVSRESWEWMLANVPEADDHPSRIRFFELMAWLESMLTDWPVDVLPTEQMVVAERNRACRAAGEAWDAFAAEIHNVDWYTAAQAACEQRGIDNQTLRAALDTVRQVVADTRTPKKLPKGGRPRTTRVHFLLMAADKAQSILGVSDKRAREIVEAVAATLGTTASAASLTTTSRNRRL